MTWTQHGHDDHHYDNDNDNDNNDNNRDNNNSDDTFNGDGLVFISSQFLFLRLLAVVS